jgi:hypothetical protein
MAKKKAAKKTKKKAKKKMDSDMSPSIHSPNLEDKARWSLDTLMESERIRGDKKLMKAIDKEKVKRQKALDKV